MRHLMLVAAFALAAVPAAAETLYKLVSRDGKVTYSSEPPKDFDGKVIKLEIDPNANTAQGRKVAPGAKGNVGIVESKPSAGQEDKLRAAKEKLEAARLAYEQARDNPGENDVRRIGNAKGGARPVFSEEYQKKLEKLENEMKQAQADLDRLEHGR